MTEETRNVIMRNGKMYVGGDVTKEYVDNAISNAVADIDDDISALSDTVADKVDKVSGKSLSTNDYTDADKALVQDSPITVTATGAEITASTAQGNLNALAVYGKSEVVDGAITSAGESGSIEIETCGKNLLDPTKYYQRSGYTNLTVNYTNNVIQIGNINSGGRFIAWNIKTTPGERITISWNNLTNVASIGTTQQETFVDIWTGYGVSIGSGSTIIATTEWLQVYAELQLTEQATATIAEIQVEKGSTATTYEPYNGTMATFTTGTPLRGIPDSNVRDVMEWDGSAGTVTKNCEEKKLSDLSIAFRGDQQEDYNSFYCSIANINAFVNNNTPPKLLSNDFTPVAWNTTWSPGNISILSTAQDVVVFTTSKDITTVEQFLVAFGNSKLLYPLATPTTQQLTSTENASIAGLRTFEPQTHAQNNAGATMTVEAYAGTANGQAVNELKQDVQSEISALKITQSGTLTLTTTGWSNNTQTVSYAHDTAKRNVIDVEPANIKAWTAAGILATAETASTITFECDTVPTADLSFRVTSMEVR